MKPEKDDNARRELFSLRQRQKQLGRGLRMMYEQVLREPVPVDMVDALHAAVRAEVAEADGGLRSPQAR